MPQDLSELDGVIEKAEEIEQKSIQDQALEHVDGAMGSLAKFSKGHQVGGVKPSAATIYNASKSIIEFAGGKPETREPVMTESKGVQIFIQQFGSGESRSIEAVAPIDVDPHSPNAALATAEHVVNTVTKAYEVKKGED